MAFKIIPEGCMGEHYSNFAW